MSQLKINRHELLQLKNAFKKARWEMSGGHSFQNMFLFSDLEMHIKQTLNILWPVTQSDTCCKLGWKLLHTSERSQITKFIWLELNLILNNPSRETDPEMTLKCSLLTYYEMITVCTLMSHPHQSTFTNVSVLSSQRIYCQFFRWIWGRKNLDWPALVTHTTHYLRALLLF